jgi:hypothetical protein
VAKKRRVADDELEEQHANAPNVNVLVVALISYHFWGEVNGRPAKGVSHVALKVHVVAPAKIRQFQLVIFR